MPIAPDCMTRASLRALVVSVLEAAATDAGTTVFSPDNFPENPSDLPALAVQTPTDRKEGQGRGQRAYFTTIVVAVQARVTGTAGMSTEAALDRLCAQVEDAVLSSPDLQRVAQQIGRVETTMVLDVAGEAQIGEAVILFDVEVFQQWVPAPGLPLTVTATATAASTSISLGVPGPSLT